MLREVKYYCELESNDFKQTGGLRVGKRVEFKTSNEKLLMLYERSEEALKNNIKYFGDKKVLIEGGGYFNVWMETQPMGGEMYWKRDPEIALNNQLIFLENQREDGRLPGMISYQNGNIIPCFTHLQGFCFPYHAVNIYYLNKLKKDYLEYLYECFERFDKYLWNERDPNGDGCLETWCEWDTGEDNFKLLEGAPHGWSNNYPPENAGNMPLKSISCMGYSRDGRATLAEISEILQNGKTKYWKEKTKQVDDKMRSYLWREDKGAFYDRDKNGNFLDCLYQGNMKAMYFGCFSNDMAERFINEHLHNKEEFDTPMPLPAVAINDKYYYNDPINCWSGQCQSLNFQRSIRAFENYNKFSEITVVAEKFLKNMYSQKFFPQQFDPFTGEAQIGFNDGYYGPCMLTVLEYVSRLYGIHINRKEIYFGCISDRGESEYSQIFADRKYELKNNGERATAYIDGKKVFDTDSGVRVITDYDGNIKRVINIKEHSDVFTVCGKRIFLQSDESIETSALDKFYIRGNR